MAIWVDADACPNVIKEILFRAAERVQMPLTLVAIAASVIGGIVVLYAFGIVGMSIALNKTLAECAALVTAFLPGDLIKAVLTGLITQALARSRPASLLSRP